MRLFRRTLEKPIPVPMAESLKRLERRAYRGGRVECFVASTEYCMVDDVNSMYPFVMQSREYPESYVGTWTRTYRGKHGLYTGQFTQTARQYPAVLFDETKQDYSYDGSGTFAQPDIERLLEIGGSFTCEEGYEFMRMGKIFETFVNRWYGIRQEAKARNDEALSYVCKILMNSLYGKFGQKEEREATKILDGETIKSMVERGEGPTVYPNGVVVVKEKTYRQNGFVSVAAYVTAHARVELHRRMCEVIDQGYRVLYVDTDSVHHTGATLERSDALGSMKLEYQGIMTHIGRKLYATVDGDVKAKGVGKAAKPSYEEMVAMLDGWSKTIEFTVMPTWREIIIGGKDAAKPFLRKRTIRRTA
jgi:DNA polymerase elongation subunit (family B)